MTAESRSSHRPETALLARSVVDVLAVYRLWRLAAEDSILDRPRAFLIAWAWDRHHARVDPAARPGEDPPPKIIELLGCPWCLGLWLSLAALAGRQTRLWQLARGPLALSAAVGIVAETVRRIER